MTNDFSSNITYGKAKLKDISIAPCGSVSFDGQIAAPSPRFWRSVSQKLGITPNIFKLFTPDEVFDRLAKNNGDRAITYTLEGDKVLAVSDNDFLPVDNVVDLIEQRGGEKISYANGVVSSTFTPRSGQRAFKIGNDEFQTRYQLRVPIDGMGNPHTFLSMLRLVCLNGMVAETPSFRTVIQTGREGAMFSIARFLDAYDNSRGFEVLENRVEQSQTSWASVRETEALRRTLEAAGASLETLRAYEQLTGSALEVFGIASIDAISPKRRSMLPSKASVYDLINFATEFSTHHASEASQKRAISGALGSMLAQEYDLEGTKEVVTDYRDFFLREAV